jgi:hypothetical protein
VAHYEGLPPPEVIASLVGPLTSGRPHASVLEGAPVWQWAGHDGDAWRVVLFNDTTAPSRARLRLPFPAPAVQEWDATDGSQGHWWAAGGPGPDGAFDVGLEAMELRCYRLRPVAAGEELPAAPGHAPGPVTPAAGDVPAPTGGPVLGGRWTLELPAGSGAVVPISVSAGWERQGFPGLSGAGRYVCALEVPAGPVDVVVELPEVNTAVEVEVNGHPVGRRAWSPYRFTVPAEVLRPGANELALTVYSAAGNRYYGGTPYQDEPEPSGLGAPPVVVALGAQVPG